MKKLMKKALVGILAATMMLGSVCTAYAATGSATVAPAPVKENDVKTDKGTVNTHADGTITVKALAKTNAKSVAVASKITVDGISYKVTKICEGTFKKATKATKAIVFNSKKAVVVSKTAFKGVDTKKMTIKVTNMSKKQLKVFKANLKKAGFKGTVKVVK